MQKYQAAVPPLREAVASQPSSLQVQQLLAVALIGQEDYLGAIPHLHLLASMNPQEVGVSYLLTRAYLQTKQYDEALAAFRHTDEFHRELEISHRLQKQILLKASGSRGDPSRV
jgi:cytochrome c-type biogenesis protein CcmH/NrfG